MRKIHSGLVCASAVLSLLFVTEASHAEITIEEFVQQAQIVEGDVAVRDMPRWGGARKILLRDIGVDFGGDVVMTNMQKMSSPVIAEHAIAMAMSLTRHIPQLVNAMDEHDWEASVVATQGMTPIAGKRLLVAGLGGIGTEAAPISSIMLDCHTSFMRSRQRPM